MSGIITDRYFFFNRCPGEASESKMNGVDDTKACSMTLLLSYFSFLKCYWAILVWQPVHQPVVTVKDNVTRVPGVSLPHLNLGPISSDISEDLSIQAQRLESETRVCLCINIYERPHRLFSAEGLSVFLFFISCNIWSKNVIKCYIKL